MPLKKVEAQQQKKKNKLNVVLLMKESLLVAEKHPDEPAQEIKKHQQPRDLPQGVIDPVTDKFLLRKTDLV